MIKILIADDHELVREGLKKVIKAEVDMKIVGEESDACGIIKFVINNDCDIIILDLSLPDRSGFDVLVDLKKIKPDVKVVILSMFPENVYAERALSLGAWGYLSKDYPADEIINAVRKIISGRRYFSENIAQKLAERLDSNIGEAGHESLSERELDVMVKIGQGKTVKEIADELSVSQSSVNTYRSRIFEKMNFKSNTEIIYYAIQNKLIEFKL